MEEVIYRHGIYLRIGFLQRLAENIYQSCRQLRVLSHDFHHIKDRHGDGLCLLKRNSSVRTARFRRTKLANHVPTFPYIVNDFVTVRRNCSDLYKSVQKKEERPLRVSHFVENLFLLERSSLSV